MTAPPPPQGPDPGLNRVVVVLAVLMAVSLLAALLAGAIERGWLG